MSTTHTIRPSVLVHMANGTQKPINEVCVGDTAASHTSVKKSKPRNIGLVAYHGDPTIKEKYLARVEAHRLADDILQRYGYWKDGKGCAVGCTLHSDEHDDYESVLGIPEPIAQLEDVIFEGLPVELARAWPSRFLTVIPVGADLSQVPDRFCFWLLTSPDMQLDELAEPDGKLAITRVVDLYRRRLDCDKPTATEWAAARTAASDATKAAALAAALTTTSDAARSAASYAASVAARVAVSTAVNDAGNAAAWAAAWAAGSIVGGIASRAAAWVLMATCLEDLLGSAPIADS